MVDTLVTFNEGEDILASQTNQNNQFLLNKLTDNAKQLLDYTKQQLSSIQSNLSSVQSTLQNNINKLSENMTNSNNSLKTYYIPNYSKGISISSGWTATKNGWLNWSPINIDDGGSGNVKVNNVQVGYYSRYKYANIYNTQFLIGKGDKITFTSGITVKFYPCQGA